MDLTQLSAIKYAKMMASIPKGRQPVRSNPVGGKTLNYSFNKINPKAPQHTLTYEGKNIASSLQKDAAKKKDMPHFLDQDRPEKVKDIYKALKREHPDMPAEMKARIAARQGKPGKQHQGPPYKGPVKPWKEKNSEYIEDMLQKVAMIRSVYFG